MSRTRKIVFFVVLPILSLCVLSCIALILIVPRFVSNSVATDATSAKRIAAQIADYTLPAGFEELMGMDLFTAQLVALGVEGQTGGTMIMLMQFKTAGIDHEQMETQMRQAFSRQYQAGNSQMVNAGERTVTIKGHPTTLSLSESTNLASRLRQATGVFDGRGGMVMVMVMGPADTWNWPMLEQFFQSIR